MAVTEPQSARDYGDRTAREGGHLIAGKFRSIEDFGPTILRAASWRVPSLLGDRTVNQWQQDAFGQVDAWLS